MSLVRAIADFAGAEAGELSFVKGDVLTLLENDDSGWSKGVLRGVKGWYPTNFVEVMPEEKKPAAPAAAAPFVAAAAPAPAPSVAPIVIEKKNAVSTEKPSPRVPPLAAATVAPVSARELSARSAARPESSGNGDRPTAPVAQASSGALRVGTVQMLLSPRGAKITLLKKLPRSESTEEDNVLNIFLNEPKKLETVGELLSVGSSGAGGPAKYYAGAMEMYEGYLEEIFKALKTLNAREMQGLPAPTSAVDPLNAANAKRLLDVFRNFCLALGAQETSFGMREALAVVNNLGKQLKLPAAAVEGKKIKKGEVAATSSTLEFLLGTVHALLSARESQAVENNPISTLDKDVALQTFELCFNSLAPSNAPSTRKLAGECLGLFSRFGHLDAIVQLFTAQFLRCKTDEDFRSYAEYQRAVKYLRFSLDRVKGTSLLNYLIFIVQNEGKFSASSLRNAIAESLIEMLQELQAPVNLPNIADDQLRANLGANLYKIYDFALKKWIKKPKNRTWAFKLAMFMFLLFDPQRKDLSKKEITKIFLDQLRDAKQRLEGIESFSSFLRMLPPDFAKPTNPGSKVWKMVVAEALPALFVKKAKDVSAVEWKELTGVLSAMLTLDETLLTDPALTGVLKSPDYSLESRCVVLRAFGGCVVNLPDLQLGQQLQPSVTPIITQFCSNDLNASNTALLSSILVCFPSLCIPESRRQIAASLVPWALSSDPELWTCSLQALQRLLLEEPDANLGFLLTESFKFLRGRISSDEALVHVRGITLLLTSFLNTRKSINKGASAISLDSLKSFCLCWAMDLDSQVRDEAVRLMQVIGQINESDPLPKVVASVIQRVRPDKSTWIVELCASIVQEAPKLGSLVPDAWLLLKEPLRLEAHSVFFAKTLHLVSGGDISQVAFDVIGSMMAALATEEISPSLRNTVCEALEQLHESCVESVARLALTAMETQKKRGPKPTTTLRAAQNKKVSAVVLLELLMLRCFATIIRKLSPARYGQSTALKGFLRERLLFWTSFQVDVALLETPFRLHLAELLRCSFVLEHGEKNGVAGEAVMSIVVSIAETSNAASSAAADDSLAALHVAIAGAVRDFLKFSSISTNKLMSDWVPFAFATAKAYSSAAVDDAIEDGLAGLIERFPAKLLLFVLDALREENMLVFQALFKTFSRKPAMWMTRSSETMLVVALLKMMAPTCAVRERAVALANVLAKEGLSPERPLFYTRKLDMNMYVRSALDYSRDIAIRKVSMTPAMVGAFAAVFKHLSDQQKTLSLMVLQCWMQNFATVCSQNKEGAVAILDGVLKMSVDSDAVFHREHLQWLYGSLSFKGDDQIRVAIEFLISRFVEFPDHCILCLSALMQTLGPAIVAVLLQNLRSYPELGLTDSIPTLAKSMDNFAEMDNRALAAFQMLEYVSLENAALLMPSVPKLLQSALLYYGSATLVQNMMQALARQKGVSAACEAAIAKLQPVLADVVTQLGKEGVSKEVALSVIDVFREACPDVQPRWATIALEWGLGCTDPRTAAASIRLWGQLEAPLTLKKAQQFGAFAFVCMYNGWMRKLFCLLEVAKSSVSVEAEARPVWTSLVCALCVSCSPVQISSALGMLKSSQLTADLHACLHTVAGTEAVFRGALMRPFFLESTREAGLAFVRAVVASAPSKQQSDFATEWVLVLSAVFAQQTEHAREEVHTWISAAIGFADFVELFSRKGFHLKTWDRRKFCFDIVTLLLARFPKSNVMDMLLVLLRNSTIEAVKAPCFRIVSALLDLSPLGLSKVQFKLLAEVTQLSVYAQNPDLRLAAEQVLLDLISQYIPDTVPQSLLTLVRVVPTNLIAVEADGGPFLFPGDSETDFFLLLKRSEIAISKALSAATPAILSAVRDQATFRLAHDTDEGRGVTKLVEVAADAAPKRLQDAASIGFLASLIDESTGPTSEPAK